MAESYSPEDVKALVRAALNRFVIAMDESSYKPHLNMDDAEARHDEAKRIAARINSYYEEIGTPQDDKTFSEMSLPPSDSPVWKELDSVPRDGTPFIVQTQHSFRWTPYKSEGTAKAGTMVERLPNGTYGRWQVYDENGHGGWVNSIQPVGQWRK